MPIIKGGRRGGAVGFMTHKEKFINAFNRTVGEGEIKFDSNTLRGSGGEVVDEHGSDFVIGGVGRVGYSLFFGRTWGRG